MGLSSFGRMKVECKNIRYVDELNLKIILSKDDLAELIKFGSLRSFNPDFEKDKAIRVIVELEVANEKI